MKTLLSILATFTMMSFQTTNSSAPFPASLNQTLIAGICGCVTEGDIQKTLLQQCKGLNTYDATTHKETKHPIINYEAVCIAKPDTSHIWKISGTAFSDDVNNFITKSKPGDQIIFRSIHAEVKKGCTQSLNSIPLTIR